MFHMLLKRMCALVFMDTMSWKYQFSLTILWHHPESVVLLIFCLEDLSFDVSDMFKSLTIIVFPSISPFMSVSIYVFSCSYIDWIYVDECTVISLYWSFYHNIVSFFISLNNLWLKVYFVWYECCNPCFLVISICLKWFFPYSHFQSVCIICPKMSLL